MNTLTQRAAEELLKRDGAGVIWQAHLTAARLDREGNRHAADILLAVADAAEKAVGRTAPSERVPGRLGENAGTQAGGSKLEPLNNERTWHSERRRQVYRI